MSTTTIWVMGIINFLIVTLVTIFNVESRRDPPKSEELGIPTPVPTPLNTS